MRMKTILKSFIIRISCLMYINSSNLDLKLFLPLNRYRAPLKVLKCENFDRSDCHDFLATLGLKYLKKIFMGYNLGRKVSYAYAQPNFKENCFMSLANFVSFGPFISVRVRKFLLLL
jgi:hypothetical protein